MPPSRKKTEEGTADVQAILLEWISTSRYEPGDKIPTERQLAQSLKRPRHVVRSALLALAERGLLVRHVGRGTFVTPACGPAQSDGESPAIRMPSLAELLEARLAFEPALARLAGTRTSPDEIDRLERRRAAFDSARTLAELEHAEAEFYRTLADVVGNSVLMDMAHVLASSWRRLLEARSESPFFSEIRREKAQEAAGELIDSLRALDAPRAERARVSALLDLMEQFSVFALMDEAVGRNSSVSNRDVAGGEKGNADETDSGDR
jgi:DNA-binding FadR family transcriptional regulator